MRQKKGTYKAVRVAAMLIAAMAVAGNARGQANPATAFYWENPYAINPASIRTEAMAHFSLSARKQWIGIQGSPATFFATAALYSPRYRMQGGAGIVSDRIGYLHSSELSLSYAYALPLRNGNMHLGLSIGWQWQGIDREKVAAEEENDPTLANLPKTRKGWNAGLGVEYAIGSSLTIGAATKNLRSFFKRERAVFGGTNHLYGRYRARVMGRAYRPTPYRTTASPTTFDLEGGVCLKQYQNEFQTDAMISLYMNHHTQKEKLQLSVIGRSIGEIGCLAGIKLMNEFKILCCYDYNFKAWKNNAKGTCEVIITYSIPQKKCVFVR